MPERLSIFVNHFDVGADEADFRMLLQKGNLFFQSIGRREVIAVNHGAQVCFRLLHEKCARGPVFQAAAGEYLSW